MLKALARAHHLLKPQIILPVLLAAALLVFAFKLGNLHQMTSRLARLPLLAVGISVAAAACYLACKAVQLKMMLVRIGVHIPARPFWLAFAVGEMTVTLPLGLFSQNWVMSASQRINVGRSSAATVMMLLVEIAAVFLLLAIVGIPGWPQMRPLAVAALVALAGFMFGMLCFEHKVRALASRIRHPRIAHAAHAAFELMDGLRRLFVPTILSLNLVLAAVYLGALVVAFWIVGRGMGLHHLDYLTAARIYGFSLAVILIGAGLISQIGTLDVLGMLAAHACGIGYTDGLALMLGFRIVWTGSIWLLCLPIVGALWREIPMPRDKTSADGGKELPD